MSDLKRHPEAPEPAQVVAALGYGPMDTIHSEFEELLAHADVPGERDWASVLGRIDAHLREHFEVENLWMTETEFPPRDCHIDEHAAVLQSSAQVLALAMQGNTDAAPSFIKELIKWFPGHAAYLDSALAAWMCKRQLGGKPVVLHRTRRTEEVRT